MAQSQCVSAACDVFYLGMCSISGLGAAGGGCVCGAVCALFVGIFAGVVMERRGLCYFGARAGTRVYVRTVFAVGRVNYPTQPTVCDQHSRSTKHSPARAVTVNNGSAAESLGS